MPRTVGYIVSFIFDAMRELTKNNDGNYVLGFIETKAYIDANGKNKSLYGTSARGEMIQAHKQIMQAEMTDWLKVTPVINHGIHLDTYLTDMDIKDLLEQYIWANSWKYMTTEVCKACYMHIYNLTNLPDWGLIQRERW